MMRMRLLRAVRTAHLWCGAAIMLPLIMIVLSGTLLIFDNHMVRLRAPELFKPLPALNIEVQARDMETIDALAGDISWNLTRLPQPDRPFYDVWLMTDERAYMAIGADEFSDRFFWYERPETFIFEVHAHLVAGEIGELIVGYIGLAALIMLGSGIFIWWPGRHGFKWQRLKPDAGSRRSLLRNHAAIGIVSAAPIAFLFATGVMTVFPSETRAVFGAVAGREAPTLPEISVPDFPDDRPDWEAVLTVAHGAFEDDSPVFLFTPPPGEDGAIYMRTRLDQEWHPNGRSEIYIDASTATLMAKRDLNEAEAGLRAAHAIFPLHATRGGAWWLAPFAVLTGLAALVMLWAGTLAFLKRLKRTKGP